MKEIFIVTTILTLILLGLAIALRSGVVDQKGDGGLRVLAANASGMLLRVAGYLAGLLLVQRIIGSPWVLNW
jgi:hypothetical protein